MKYGLCLLFIVMVMPWSANVLAVEDDEHEIEQRIMHYDVPLLDTREQAIELLKQKMAEVEAILQQDRLDDSAMEHVHELSYSLEAAADRLLEEPQEGEERFLHDLDAAVQLLHYVSENHEEKKIRKWFNELVNVCKDIK